MRWWVSGVMQLWKLAKTRNELFSAGLWYPVLLRHKNPRVGQSSDEWQSTWCTRRPLRLHCRLEDVSFRRLRGDDRSVFVWRPLSGPRDDAVELYLHVRCRGMLSPSVSHAIRSNSFGSPPSYRDFHTATVIFDRMYIFGGRGDVHSPYHSQDEIYCPKIVYLDLKTHQWVMPTTTNKQPVGRRSHSACKSLRRVFACSQPFNTEHHVTLHNCNLVYRIVN